MIGSPLLSKRYRYPLYLFTLLLVLSLMACTTSTKDSQQQEWEELKNQQRLEVEFSTSPTSPVQVGETVQLAVKVLYGEEPVLDADEVLFEIWHEDENEQRDSHELNHEDEHRDHNSEDMLDEDENSHPVSHGMQNKEDMLPFTHHEAGLYSLETTFERPGKYYVMYHVTAKNQHNMRQFELIVE